MISPGTTLASISMQAVWDFLSKPVYVLGVLLGLAILIVLIKYFAYDLPRKPKRVPPQIYEPVVTAPVKKKRMFSKKKASAPTPNEEDAKVAAVIAASIVAMDEDRALIAAITAAVQAYLEAENEGKTLPSGFRVVSFSRRKSGSWNR